MVQVLELIDWKDSLSMLKHELRNYRENSTLDKEVMISHLKALEMYFAERDGHFGEEGIYWIREFRKELEEERPNYSLMKLFLKGMRNCVYTFE